MSQSQSPRPKNLDLKLPEMFSPTPIPKLNLPPISLHTTFKEDKFPFFQDPDDTITNQMTNPNEWGVFARNISCDTSSDFERLPSPPSHHSVLMASSDKGVIPERKLMEINKMINITNKTKAAQTSNLDVFNNQNSQLSKIKLHGPPQFTGKGSFYNTLNYSDFSKKLDQRNSLFNVNLSLLDSGYQVGTANKYLFSVVNQVSLLNSLWGSNLD